jgi:pimeloyl-ACP methyl ester carboxylesterase
MNAMNVSDRGGGRAAGNEPALCERSVSVLGYRMAYVTGGEGEPVILLHGLGLAASSWQWVLPTLARHFRVYAIDMFGCGRSDTPRIDYSLWAMATYTRYFMDAVGLQQAHFIGHSLGGGVAMHTRLQYPDRVGRLGLIAPGGMGRELRWLLRLPTLPGAELVMNVATRPLWDRIIKWLGYVEPTALHKRETRQGWLDLSHADRRWAFLRMLRGVSNITGQTVSALDRLHLMQQPALLIWGARDRTLPVIQAQRAARLIPNCQLEILPDCGHYPALERPEQVATLLERFLLAPSPASSTIPVAELESADHRKMRVEKPGELTAGIA